MRSGAAAANHAGRTEMANSAAGTSSPTVLLRQLVLIGQGNGRIMLSWPLTGVILVVAVPERLVEIQAMVLGFGFIMGGAWGLGVWSGQAPVERLYHRMLPVGRCRHDLLRVLAGLLWLLAMLAVFYAMALGAGRWPPWPAIPLGYWVNLVTAPLTAYLVVAAFAVAVNRPGLWFVLTLGTAVGVLRLSEWLEWGRVTGLLEFLLAGRYGVGEAIAGSLRYVPVTAGATPPARWLYVALAWLALSVAGVILASRVHHDVR